MAFSSQTSDMKPTPILPEEMEAYRWYPGAKTLTQAKVAVPTPAEYEVLVKILAAGMCHSDLMFYEDTYKLGRTKPFTMGHEGAGEIIALGNSVPSLFPDLHLNQYIVIHSKNACYLPSCPECSIGADNLCTQHLPLGLGVDGAYAPFMVVPARNIVPVNATKEEIPPAVAAVATDAVLTSYHSLRDVKVGETVLIVGIGGLGTNALQIAKNVKGAQTVIACDNRGVALQAALEVGADYAVKPEELPSLLTSNKLVVDTACDFVGTGTTFKSILEHVRPGGTILLIGLGAPFVELPLIAAGRKEITIKSNFWGKKHELAEVLEILKSRRVTPVVEVRSLSEAAEVFEEMRNARLKGRVALVPN
ncbi:hypothetical protein GYMLUDRAFT_43946 [Collybiopsis luxurians FD-317 M1]|uniref:Enoyl reductase (ER) domain-containing protein n=1 Tax=Collybiopsis luxurians FD-317 M1 TaxID=944289 RepID=A0A0D0BX13_9AGAR|nr:hypothetical protein GYMLUDRAFT_43946 [Collybiopsis luxurians FD-317 M1]